MKNQISFYSQYQKVMTAVVITLLFLHFVFSPLATFVLASENQGQNSQDFSAFVPMYAYTLIILGILLLRKKKGGVEFDKLSLWIIAFSCLVRYPTGSKYDSFSSLYLGVLGLGLIVYIFTNRGNIKTPTLKSIATSLLWALLTTIIVSLTIASIASTPNTSMPPQWWTALLSDTLLQLSFVTIIEETFFRGLFVSFLLYNGWEENKAFIVQALLFWVAHYMEYNNHVVLFIFVPLLTISVTLIVKRYKMIYTSILVHTIANVFTTILAIWIKINLL